MTSKYLTSLLSRYKGLSSLGTDINEVFEIIKECYKKEGTLFVCGNGGSAADSEHIVGELMKGFVLPRNLKDDKMKKKLESLYGEEGILLSKSLQMGLRAVSLMSHPSLYSAFANDVNAEMVFAQQLYVLAKAEDVLFAISTSGNARNVVRAMQVASVIGVKSILLTGMHGGEGSKVAHKTIKVPEKETYKIQEYHLPIYHTLCLMLEEYFYA
jgi:D-sedoheptulose 7-phosphate isomerase